MEVQLQGWFLLRCALPTLIALTRLIDISNMMIIAMALRVALIKSFTGEYRAHLAFSRADTPSVHMLAAGPHTTQPISPLYIPYYYMVVFMFFSIIPT